jgi:hypothetical protein
MIVKRIAGKIYGADLTKAEQQALTIEIRKEIAAQQVNIAQDLDAIILYHVHRCTGYGAVRLKRFYMDFIKDHRALIRTYEFDEEDAAWYAKQQLGKMGIDLDAWYKEAE